MTDILAEAGRITGLGPEIDGKISFGIAVRLRKAGWPKADEMCRAWPVS